MSLNWYFNQPEPLWDKQRLHELLLSMWDRWQKSTEGLALAEVNRRALLNKVILHSWMQLCLHDVTVSAGRYCCGAAVVRGGGGSAVCACVTFPLLSSVSCSCSTLSAYRWRSFQTDCNANVPAVFIYLFIISAVALVETILKLKSYERDDEMFWTI